MRDNFEDHLSQLQFKKEAKIAIEVADFLESIVSEPFSLSNFIEILEIMLIERKMQELGTRAAAARFLQMNRTTIIEKLRSFGIKQSHERIDL